MPLPAEPGRPTRRSLGRGPGVPVGVQEGREGGTGRPAPDEGAGEPQCTPEAPEGREAAPPAGPRDADEHDDPVRPPDAEAPAPARAPARRDAGPEAGGDGGFDPAAAPRDGEAPAGREVGAEPARYGDAPQAGGGDGVRGADGAGRSVPPRGGAGGEPGEPAAGDGRFTLRLDNFEGPFDLLLQLISRHKLDVTEVALSRVTDEFMAHIRAMGPDWDLDQTTEFLVVAATLLDLKAARLLPVAEVEDEADLALLEARDLLFARLLQYRAYKRIAEIFEDRAEAEAKRYPRTVGLEAHHADLLPEVVIGIGADGFARLAVKAMQPKARPQVYVDHIHAPLVSVREQAGLVVRMLKARGEATFQELTEDTDDTLTVVARFLALLELYREKAVVLDQEEALNTLTVRWSGGDGDGVPAVTDEFDRIIVEAKD
ncbi:segregation/condensation protein A [Streptomyces sp. NPDC059385]|uniref:segregation and condensation protein A n=1 Tax=Streptomyces sp. NPDC059385 TaxID=3346817 RepID=UPI0036CF8C2E